MQIGRLSRWQTMDCSCSLSDHTIQFIWTAQVLNFCQLSIAINLILPALKSKMADFNPGKTWTRGCYVYPTLPSAKVFAGWRCSSWRIYLCWAQKVGINSSFWNLQQSRSQAFPHVNWPTYFLWSSLFAAKHSPLEVCWFLVLDHEHWHCTFSVSLVH